MGNPIFTDHFTQRASQRAFDARYLDIVKSLGRKIYTHGDVAYFLGRRDIPQGLRKDKKIARLEGTVLIVSRSGGQEVIKTVYKNRKNGFKTLCKQLKYGIKSR